MISDYINIYIDFIKYDPSFGIMFLGLLFQGLTLIVAYIALRQVTEMKKQNKYSLQLNKIDALNRFKEIINSASHFINKIEIKLSSPAPNIELKEYTIKELTNDEDLKKFNIWVKLFSSNPDLNIEATNLANDLELFSLSLEDEDICNSISSIVAQAFCELVEGNPAIYIMNRKDDNNDIHRRYSTTIKFRNQFIIGAGSIIEREELKNKDVKEYEEMLSRLK